MNKKEFISKVTNTLRENNLRKPVSVKKHTFHITDSEGNEADFHIKQRDKQVIYTHDDVGNIIDACLSVVLDALKSGDEINFNGFGKLGVHYRAARRTKEPSSGEWCEIEAHYVPKLAYGTELKRAARLYEASLEEAQRLALPEPDGDL